VDVLIKDPAILGGTPVFRGTRVPLQTLFDYIEGGETLEDFLEGFLLCPENLRFLPWKPQNNS
jgi:uncharacterized protein (DUF433 family)